MAGQPDDAHVMAEVLAAKLSTDAGLEGEAGGWIGGEPGPVVGRDWCEGWGERPFMQPAAADEGGGEPPGGVPV